MEGEKMVYKMMNQDFVKLDKFDELNFIRWQDKMKFLLTALKIFYVLDPNLQPIPNPTPEDTEQLKQQRIKREEDELVCRGHILNTFSDRLYDLFTTMSFPKEIWKVLETKYKTKKRVHKLNDLSIKIPELFQVGAIIAKLPPFMEQLSEEASAYGKRTYFRTDWTLFKEYVEAGNGLEVLMGNHNTAKVLGTGTVELKLSSGKKLVLTNVYHVPNIKKNLVSASLLAKNDVFVDEEVYMDQLEGFVLPGNERKVCKLVKSLYGLKQAPKQWHENDTVILANGFKHNGADKCVYSKFTVEYGVIVCLYVDDMLIFGTNMLGVCETKKYLASMFKMKDLNEADTILGIKVKRHSEGYALCQNHYIEKVLLKYKHLNVKEVNTPFDSNYKLVENTGRAIAQLEYASVIGSMMYGMHYTRPDVAFAVNRFSRYPVVLEGYSDANWVTSMSDNKSTSGWIFTLGGGAISWASKKQSCISHSTMESEFIALASAGKEVEWLRNMFYDIELWPQPMPAISVYCDSQATMFKTYSKIYNGKSRHISLRHEYVRQLIEDGIISIVYVKSSSNLADPFTKGICKNLVAWNIIQSIGFGGLELLLDPVAGPLIQSIGCWPLELLPDPVAWTINPVD
uniref:Uncharacterized protein n=1 Tax=Fagus sylvatica TaxID=28930 RepID=A0A2N9FSX3_FAGSY